MDTRGKCYTDASGINYCDIAAHVHFHNGRVIDLDALVHTHGYTKPYMDSIAIGDERSNVNPYTNSNPSPLD